jgi:hypothetical protein
VELPDLTITNLTIRDDLPAGMAYVVGSLQLITNDAPGAFAAVTNLTPNSGVLGASGEDLVVVWEGNTLLVHQTNGADPVLVLRYDAVVLDLPANSGLVPQTVLTNRASVTYSGQPESAGGGGGAAGDLDRAAARDCQDGGAGQRRRGRSDHGDPGGDQQRAGDGLRPRCVGRVGRSSLRHGFHHERCRCPPGSPSR